MKKVSMKWWQALLACMFSAWFYFMLYIIPYSKAFPFMYMRSVVEYPHFDNIAALVTYAYSALSMYRDMRCSSFGGIYFSLFASVITSAITTYFFYCTAIVPYYTFLAALGIELL